MKKNEMKAIIKEKTEDAWSHWLDRKKRYGARDEIAKASYVEWVVLENLCKILGIDDLKYTEE